MDRKKIEYKTLETKWNIILYFIDKTTRNLI